MDRDSKPTPSGVCIRRAQRGDLEAIVALYADDAIGSTRERPGPPLAPEYETAFREIDADANQMLVVAELAGVVVGTLQLTLIPNLTHAGGRRALIEAVRVEARHRSRRLGEQLVGWAIERARIAGCTLVQLTTDVRRADARRFYARLGFVASHVGMKLHLRANEASTTDPV